MESIQRQVTVSDNPVIDSLHSGVCRRLLTRGVLLPDISIFTRYFTPSGEFTHMFIMGIIIT